MKIHEKLVKPVLEAVYQEALLREYLMEKPDDDIEEIE